MIEGRAYVKKGRKAGFSIRPREVWKELNRQRAFTDKEKVVLGDLSDYLSYENAIADHDGPMSVPQMADQLGMDVSNFNKIFRSLLRKNAVGSFESGFHKTYYMNPELYCRGNPKPWLEQQFSHKATVAWNDGAKIVYAGKKRTAVLSWPSGKSQP